MGRTKVVRQMGQVVSLGPSWVGDVVVVVAVVVLAASWMLDGPLVGRVGRSAMVVVFGGVGALLVRLRVGVCVELLVWVGIEVMSAGRATQVIE